MNTSSLQASLLRLYARQAHGIKPGLDSIRALLQRLGNPESGIAAVHVAGTNGKGSTCALIARGLQTLGLPIGLTTSPHLVRFNERFQINGLPISDDELQRHLDLVESTALDLEHSSSIIPTFFECAIAIAFLHFKEHGVRIAVVETGLGGRLDATNILTPLVSVITRIALDHMQYLGNSLPEIASEKAGILKPGRPAVIAAMPEEAFQTIALAAQRIGSPIIHVPDAVSVRRTRGSLEGQAFSISSASCDYGTLKTPLAASYQSENIATAIATLELLRDRIGLPLPDNAIPTALREVSWPGRMQCVQHNPTIVLDGAHNPDGATALVHALHDAKIPKNSIALICGFCADKDIDGFFRILAPWVRRAWSVPIPNPRSLSPQDAATKASRFRIPISPASSLSDALSSAIPYASSENIPLFLCGSLFLVGQALPLFSTPTRET